LRTALDGQIGMPREWALTLCNEWVISTATVGSGYMVRIDDASGAVLEVAPWGVR